MAATLGAGVQDGELYAAMAEHNAIAVGGENNVRVLLLALSQFLIGVFLTFTGCWSRWVGYRGRPWSRNWCVRYGRR